MLVRAQPSWLELKVHNAEYLRLAEEGSLFPPRPISPNYVVGGPRRPGPRGEALDRVKSGPRPSPELRPATTRVPELEAMVRWRPPRAHLG